MGRQGGGGDGGSPGQVQRAPGDSADHAEQEQQWRQAVSQAARAAKAQGDLPGCLQRLVEDILAPRVDWREVLQQFIARTARNDYDWSRPSRRFAHRGDVVLPSLRSNELPPIVVVVDTSGSIGAEEMNQFLGEVEGILGQYPTTIHLLWADAQVAGVDVLTQADLPLTGLEPKGGGGTNFIPAFEWVEEEQLELSCLVYLTDMYGTFPTVEPTYPTLWVATSDVVAPWGETVPMRMD